MKEERHQSRPEMYKAIVTFVGQLAIAAAGFFIAFSLDRAKDGSEAEAKRIEYRVTFYKSVASDLDTMYTFVCRIGNYSYITPGTVGRIKRHLDAEFLVNLPLMSDQTFAAYKSFTDTFVVHARGEAKHFGFKVPLDPYRLAYNQRMEEYQARKNDQEPKPRSVSDAELHEWLTDEDAKLGPELKSRYAALLASFARDSGFLSEKQSISASDLACNY
jgi:hypothetical protein